MGARASGAVVRPRSAFLRVGVVLALVVGCGGAPPEAPPVVRPVKLFTVGGGEAGGRREYPATLSPVVDALLGFEVPGRIVEFPVVEGEQVQAGHVLARIDARDYEARLAAARARVHKAEADLGRGLAVRREDPGAISLSMIDTWRRSVDVARAEEAEAAKALDDATLRAPFAGRIARKLVEDYANVQAKEPVVNLQDDSVIEAVVNLPERDLATMSPGQGGREAATVRFRPEIMIPGQEGRAYPAEVRELSTTADPATRTFKLTLRLDRPADVVMLPGMTGKASLAIDGAEAQPGGVLRVPAYAVVTGPEREPFVWVVDRETMQVERRAVRIGRIVSEEIEVLSGLQAGEMIATAGVQALHDGMTVRRLES